MTDNNQQEQQKNFNPLTDPCPKCGYIRKPDDDAPDYQCPQCDVVYRKAFKTIEEIGDEVQAVKKRRQEEAEEIKHRAEEARIEAEKRAREEEARLEAERKAAEKKAAEEARIEAERQAAEEARLEAERQAAEQARIEAEKKAAEEARIKAERQAAEEARLEAERQAVEQARIEEAEKKAAEEARIEAERQAAEEAKVEAERQAEEQARIEAEKKAAEEAQLEAERQAADAESKVKLTTTDNIDGFSVLEYIGIESVAVAIDTGDFGGSLQKSKNLAIEQLNSKALEKGADAVIGIDIDYTEFAKNKTAIIVNGTLVKLKQES